MSRFFGDSVQVAYVVPDIDTAIRRMLNSGIGPVFVMRRVRLLARHKGRENSLLITVALAYSGGIQYEFVQQHDDTPSAYLDFTAAHPHGGSHHVAHFCENFDQPLRRARELGTEFEIVQEFLAPGPPGPGARGRTGRHLDVPAGHRPPARHVHSRPVAVGGLLVRWVRTGNDRLLLWLGLVTAVALQTKYLIVGFWALVVLTALIAGPRTLPTRPRLWLAGGFAVLTSGC